MNSHEEKTFSYLDIIMKMTWIDGENGNWRISMKPTLCQMVERGLIMRNTQIKSTNTTNIRKRRPRSNNRPRPRPKGVRPSSFELVGLTDPTLAPLAPKIGRELPPAISYHLPVPLHHLKTQVKGGAHRPLSPHTRQAIPLITSCNSSPSLWV